MLPPLPASATRWSASVCVAALEQLAAAPERVRHQARPDLCKRRLPHTAQRAGSWSRLVERGKWWWRQSFANWSLSRIFPANREDNRDTSQILAVSPSIAASSPAEFQALPTTFPGPENRELQDCHQGTRLTRQGFPLPITTVATSDRRQRLPSTTVLASFSYSIASNSLPARSQNGSYIDPPPPKMARYTSHLSFVILHQVSFAPY